MADDKSQEQLSLADQIDPEDAEVLWAEPLEDDLDYSEVMSENFILYATSVITDRALPDIRDGLLPVQRRCFVSMKDRNQHSKAAYAKCAKIVGDVMGNYHPHGDSSIYGALARMAQDFSLRVPLIDGHGSFGSIDGDKPAAMRYTEARMNVASERLVADLHPEVLPNDYGRNFDESKLEPHVLPAEFPNLLINGAVGIAVGYTANFVPHNPIEAIDLCLWRLKNPEATDAALIKRMPGPDFPGGCTILDDAGLREAYTTGKGKITALADCHVEPMQGGREKIVVTSLPWMVWKDKFLTKINTKFQAGSYPELVDMNDYSEDTMRIEIHLKRGSNAAAVLNRLRKDTELRNTYGVNMNALIGGVPVQVSLPVIVDEFLSFRREVVVNRAKKRIREIDERLHKLVAYLKALSDIDRVIALMKKSADRPAAKTGLMKLLKIDEQQAQWIVELAIGNITRLDTNKLKEEDKELRAEKKHLEKLIKTPDMITEVIDGELREVKKLIGTPRLSKMVQADGTEAEEIAEAVSTAAAEDCALIVSQNGYALCSQRSSSMIIDAEDRIVVADEDANSGEERLVFTSSGKAYHLRAAELPLESKRSKGTKLSTVIGVESDDLIVAAPKLPEGDGTALFVYSSGTVKRTAWKEFESAHVSGIVAAKPAAGDQVIAVLDCPDDHDVILIASHGKAIRFSAGVLRAMGRNSNGVRGMNIPDGEFVVSAVVVSPAEASGTLLVGTSTNFAKRIPLSDIPTKGRGGGGVAIGKVNDKYGEPSTAVLVADEKDDVLLQQEKGKIAEIPAKSIVKANRAAVPKPVESEVALYFIRR